MQPPPQIFCQRNMEEITFEPNTDEPKQTWSMYISFDLCWAAKGKPRYADGQICLATLKTAWVLGLIFDALKEHNRRSCVRHNDKRRLLIFPWRTALATTCSLDACCISRWHHPAVKISLPHKRYHISGLIKVFNWGLGGFFSRSLVLPAVPHNLV